MANPIDIVISKEALAEIDEAISKIGALDKKIQSTAESFIKNSKKMVSYHIYPLHRNINFFSYHKYKKKTFRLVYLKNQIHTFDKDELTPQSHFLFCTLNIPRESILYNYKFLH